MIGIVAMTHVEPCDIHSCGDHLRETLRGRGSGPERAHNLGSTHELTLAKLRGQRETNPALVLPRTDHVQRVLKIRRIRGFELHLLTCGRMRKTEADRVQPVPLQTNLRGEGWISSICRIADAGMLNCRHVNADLMRPAGFQ